MRDSVELIEEKGKVAKNHWKMHKISDSLRHVEQQNNRRLLEQLKAFVYLMEMVQDSHIEALRNAKLSDPARYLCLGRDWFWEYKTFSGNKFFLLTNSSESHHDGSIICFSLYFA